MMGRIGGCRRWLRDHLVVGVPVPGGASAHVSRRYDRRLVVLRPAPVRGDVGSRPGLESDHAAWRGSSHYDLPHVLRWFTATSASIAFTTCRAAFLFIACPGCGRSPEPAAPRRVTLWESLRCAVWRCRTKGSARDSANQNQLRATCTAAAPAVAVLILPEYLQRSLRIGGLLSSAPSDWAAAAEARLRGRPSARSERKISCTCDVISR